MNGSGRYKPLLSAEAARAHLAMLQAKQDEAGVAPGYASPPEVWIADDVEQTTF